MFGEVDHLPVAECGGVQEAGERRQVADQTLGGDLFAQVVGDVGVEQAARTGRLVDARQVTVVQHAVQVEDGAQLGGGETAQLVAYGAPAEQIGGAAAHFAGARPAQGKVVPAILDQPVHLVQQRRHLLDLVDHDLPPAACRLRCQLLAQQLGTVEVTPEHLALQQVDPQGIGIAVPEQGALARLPRPPQKERLTPGFGQSQRTFEHPL